MKLKCLLVVGLSLTPLACRRSNEPAARFDDAFAAARRIPNLSSLVIAQDGGVVRAEYYGGADADTPQDVRSVTKSVVALALGAGVAQGCVPSLDETLGEALGPLAPADRAKAAITLRNLLTMSSGLEWSELGAQGYDQWAAAPDQVAYVLGRALVAAPGSTFTYDSGAFHLLSVALTRACGPTADFVGRALLAPLGIASRAWEQDNQGFTNGAAGLQLTPRELVALGALVLSGGQSEAGRLVPGDFVDAATREAIATGSSPAAATPAYGYGWWVGETTSGARFAMAEGYGGQFLLVVPSARAVVVATSRWQGVGASVAAEQFDQVLEVIEGEVLDGL